MSVGLSYFNLGKLGKPANVSPPFGVTNLPECHDDIPGGF